MTMKIGLVGDLDANTRWLTHVLNQMGSLKISHVFVLGDFGLFTHNRNGIRFLDSINAVAEGNNLSVYALGGNHENWDHWEWYVDNLPSHKGFAAVRNNVLLAPRVHSFTLANKRIVMAAGAVSINQVELRKIETGHVNPYGRVRGGTGPRTMWWPQEVLTDDEKAAVLRSGECDVLLTHDCSTHTPFTRRLVDNAPSQENREFIDSLIEKTRPDFHAHGHMHEFYDWENRAARTDGGVTRTIGLNCDGVPKNWGLLNLETMDFDVEGVETKKTQEARRAAKAAEAAKSAAGSGGE